MAASVQLTATTLEGQMWEVANRLQLAEKLDTTNNPNNVQTTVDTDAQTVSVTFTCPATFSIGATGQLVATPTTYLT